MCLQYNSTSLIVCVVVHVHVVKFFSYLLNLLLSRQPYIAGIYLIGSGSTIHSGTERSLVDSACNFRGPKTIYPFAFRTHAHHLGMYSNIRTVLTVLYYKYVHFHVYSVLCTFVAGIETGLKISCLSMQANKHKSK